MAKPKQGDCLLKWKTEIEPRVSKHNRQNVQDILENHPSTKNQENHNLNFKKETIN